MNEICGELTIDEASKRLSLVDISEDPNAEEKALRPTVESLKASSLNYAARNDAKPWLISVLEYETHLDGIIAEMGHLKDGQVFALNELKKVKSDLKWYRGGSLAKWKDVVAPANAGYFTQKQLDTYVIDQGANGVLGRPNLALSYLRRVPRTVPVLYSLSINDLLDGIEKKAIRLVTEHFYDLRVIEGNDRMDYLDFCRNRLKFQRISPIPQPKSVV